MTTLGLVLLGFVAGYTVGLFTVYYGLARHERLFITCPDCGMPHRADQGACGQS